MKVCVNGKKCCVKNLKEKEVLKCKINEGLNNGRNVVEIELPNAQMPSKTEGEKRSLGVAVKYFMVR